MDWTKSYTAIWRVYKVNRRTWEDGDPLNKVDSFSLSRMSDGSLIESGTMELSGEFESGYYRVVMIAEQGLLRERVNVATLLFNATGGKVDYGNTTHNVSGMSVLYPASTTSVDLGAYMPAGADGAQYAKDLLAKTINAPVEAHGSFTVDDYIVHETGSTVLSAVWSVLEAGGYVIQIDGRGIVHIMPKPTEPALILSGENAGLLMNGVDFSDNMNEIPNRYVVIDGDVITIAQNNDANSPVSILNRGYRVDTVDTAPTFVDGENRAEYANRMLEESSVLKEQKDYTREYAPDVYPYSIVRASVTGLDGDLRVDSQSITCGNGITVAEHAYKETKLWTR